ncbi:MAG TPA: FAD-dependent oxidoreductase, partial [Candidatus Elarobacter sp.]
MADEQYDVLVIGSSLGGVAAALRAAAMGASVCLIDPGAWVGGQFTAQGVSKPDENKYIETVGSTAAYREFRHTVRAWYRANARLSAVGSSQPLFNPGGPYNPAQPQFAVEPKLGDTILKQMIQGTPKLAWRPNTTVVGFEFAGDAIAAVNTRAAAGSATRYVAQYVLDATDLGDCLPHVLRDGEWVLGAEAHADTGEAGAPANPEPTWIQPVTVICAIEHRPRGENHTIPEPPNYARHRDEQKYSLKDGAITSMFGGGTTMFNYRQYLDARNFNDPNFRYDRTTLNAGANDYGVKSIPTGDPAEDARIIQEARDASLGFLYWLQTECPRDDHSGTGYPELRPVTEAFGTADGMAPVAYIRESRRIKALNTIVRSEVEQSSANRGPRAQLFDDSCGVGTYAFMDGHALPGEGMSGFWIDIWPAQISTRALIPERVTNLLAACKNLGTTHFTNGLYRLHPFEWNIGESAGALAAFCLSQGTTPHAVAADGHLMRAYQRALLAEGVPLF